MILSSMLRPFRPALLPLLALGFVTPAVLAQDAETAQPRPAEIAPKSAQALLTAITSAGDHLVAVGSRGHVLVSTADQTRWKQVPIPVRGLLTDVRFIDERTGWVVGHDAVILKTTDAGETWTLQHFDATAEPLLTVVPVSAEHIYAFGAYGLLLESTDGGANWAPKASEIADEGFHLNAVTRLGDNSLLLVGEMGMLARSEDNGETWARLPAPYDSSLFAVAAKGEKGAVIAGLRGNVFVTEDVSAGEWTAIETDSVQSIFNIVPQADGGYVLVGLNASLLRLAPDGRVSELSPQLVEADGVVPELPHVALKANGVNDVEAGAYADAELVAGGLVTVGDFGIRRWSLN